MAVAKVECPECGAVLRPAKPLTPGKKVRCPRCENPLVVPGGDGEGDGPAEAGGKITTAPKKSRAKPPPAPDERKPAAAHDEDEGGTYRFLDESGPAEEEEEEKKPKIEYVPNLEVKDPRGPATAALATPSSFILLLGALMCVGGLLGVCISLWPFFFTKYGTGVAPSQAKKEYDRKHPKKQDEKAGAKKEDKEDDTWVDEEKV